MSILDDAIREHLELKRAHGADDAEVKRLEDEAFGPPQRPDEIDPFSEAPTEFLTSPGEVAADLPEVGDEGERSGRRPNLTDLQEPPPAEDAAGWPPADEPEALDAEPPSADKLEPPVDAGFPSADAAPAPPPAEAAEMPAAPAADELSPPPDAPPPSPADAAEMPLPPPPGGAPAAGLAPPPGEAPAPPADRGAAASFFDQELVLPTEEAPPPPAEEPAEEHPVDSHDADAEPSAAERQAIADQPTQMFDVQAHVEAEAAAEAPPTGERESPSDEELVDAAREDPQAAPAAPDEPEPEEGSAEFDFFNEQRLSDELDQALEAPLPPTEEHLAMPRYKDEPDEPDPGGDAIFDFDSEPEEQRSQAEEQPAAAAADDEADDGEDATGYDPETGHDDVLEDTPRFLEDAPEDDDLWFEQKPPKDFDLD